jgi:hypothetical protein
MDQSVEDKKDASKCINQGHLREIETRRSVIAAETCNLLKGTLNFSAAQINSLKRTQ